MSPWTRVAFLLWRIIERKVRAEHNSVCELITIGKAGRSIHGVEMRVALILWLWVHHGPHFSSYSGCWHLKQWPSSSSWAARGVWESCSWTQLPMPWPISSPSSTACRESSSSWCTVSSASRYHSLTPSQHPFHSHSSQWADSEHALSLQVREQYRQWLKEIKKTKVDSEKYTLSSMAMSESSKDNVVGPTLLSEPFMNWSTQVAHAHHTGQPACIAGDALAWLPMPSLVDTLQGISFSWIEVFPYFHSLCFCAHLNLTDDYLLTPHVCRTPTLCDLVHVVFNLTKWEDTKTSS